jgi:hypothetical protein
MDIQCLSKKLEEGVDGRGLTAWWRSILRIQPLERNELNRNNARLLLKSLVTMKEGTVRVPGHAADDKPPLSTDADLPDLRTLRFAS